MLGPWRLGVMQGRLLPKYKSRYQAHPKDCWQDEFSRAAGLGLDLIEFILDFESAAENPLLADVKAIQAVTQSSGVGVTSVCADYFMEAPLHRADTAAASGAVLDRLLDSAAKLAISDLVIPCVDQSRLADETDEARLVAALTRALPKAERIGVNLSLETDLAPARFGRLLACLPSSRVTVNYDIGNSAALGYDPSAEWDVYGGRVSDVHIKDRTLGGGSVELGAGNADIPRVLDLMRQRGFAGPVIMQAFRDDEGLAAFRQQLNWLSSHWSDYTPR